MLWPAQVLRDTGFTEYVGKNHGLVDMRADNQGGIELVKTPKSYEKSKHKGIFYHFIRGIEAQKLLHITHEPASPMIAGRFTKQLDKTLFQRFGVVMGLSDETHSMEVQ